MVQRALLAAMRPSGTPQQLEKRRRLAIEMLQAGKQAATVARAVSASRSSVQRWRECYERDGAAGLRSKPIPGRPAGLTDKQKARLERLLLKGAVSAGYSTDLWTLDRIGQMIWKHFHIRYHPGHVWRILREMGWSSQKLERRPIQRDEAATLAPRAGRVRVAHWRRYRWLWIKKG